MTRKDKDFRRGIAVLKKAGILSKKLDVNKATPNWVRSAGPRGGVYTLKELIVKYDDLISGKDQAIQVPASVKPKLLKTGYQEIKGGKILYPVHATEKVQIRNGVAAIDKNGDIVVKSIYGIERTHIPVEYHNLPQYLRDLKKNEKLMQRLKKKGARFGFRYWGNHSDYFENFDQMIDHFEKYESVIRSIEKWNKGDAKEMNEVYRNFEIVTTDKKAWLKSMATARAVKKAQKKPIKARRSKALNRAKGRGDSATAEYRRKRAAEAKQYRLSLSGSALEEYKKDARKRAAKSRKK